MNYGIIDNLPIDYQFSTKSKKSLNFTESGFIKIKIKEFMSYLKQLAQQWDLKVGFQTLHLIL